MARRKAPLIPDELQDQLLAGRDPQPALGRDGLVDELKRALAERALNALDPAPSSCDPVRSNVLQSRRIAEPPYLIQLLQTEPERPPSESPPAPHFRTNDLRSRHRRTQAPPAPKRTRAPTRRMHVRTRRP